MIFNLVLFVVAFALLAVTVGFNQEKIRDVFSRPIDPRPFLIGFVLYVIALLGTFFRWMLLVKALDLPITYRDAMRLAFIGNLYNLVVPGAVGGDVIKGMFFCRSQTEKRNTRAISSIVLDRILGLMGLFLLGGVSGIFAWPTATQGIRNLIIAIWLFFLCGAVAIAIAFSPALYRPIHRLLHNRPKLLGILHELESMAALYRKRLGVVAFGLVGSSCIHSIYVLIFYLISRSLFFNDPNLPDLGEHYVITPLVLFSIAIPLPGGALGLSEGISQTLFGFADYEGGAVAMMAFRVVMYASGLVSLVVYLANFRKVQAMLQNAKDRDRAAATVPDSAFHPVVGPEAPALES